MRIHPYHLVDVSPWPLLTSLTVLGFALNQIFWLNHQGSILLLLQLFTLLLIAYQWWRDIIREGIGGYHTQAVQHGILIGFTLFQISEIMLFFSFFWAFFHSSLSISVELGAVWPPVGIQGVNPWTIPLQGTTVLLASGFVLTLSHHSQIQGRKSLSQFSLVLTIILGIIFTILQYNEYVLSEFTISDSVFGSIFFITTGLHAVHVIVGTLFLIVAAIRIYYDHFTTEHHLGFEFAIYYWHLVDFIWILVFLLYYWWGS